MTVRQACVLVLAAFLLAGCADSLPQRGFATRFFHSSIEPELDPPTGFGGSLISAPGANHLAPNSCEAVAAVRAQDTAAQDFGRDVQQKVFDATLLDCRHWRSRSGGL